MSIRAWSSLHFILSFTFLVVLVCPFYLSAQVIVTLDQDGFSVQNRSAATLIDLKRGGSNTTELNSGSTWRDENLPQKDLFGKDVPLKFTARLKLSTWVDGFKDLPGDEIWAKIQMQTAGLNINRSSRMLTLLGAPQLSDNIVELRRVPPELSERWMHGSDLQQGLLAYASRYIPAGSLLQSLLLQNPPTYVGEKWPKAYEQLPMTRDSLREAIEVHGADALPILLTNEDWSKDRGFAEPQLAFALADEESLLNALQSRKTGEERRLINRFKEEKRLCDEYGVNAAEQQMRKLIEAMTIGDSGQALSLAVRVSLMWRRHNMFPEESQATQMICGRLDWGAQRAINEKQTLAAQAYLTLAQTLCHGVPYFRSRAAEFMRTKGDQAYFGSDYENAQHWYRGALWLSNEMLDRVRLIDTLSQLSLIYLVQDQYKEARVFLKEAKDLELPHMPMREMLSLAYNLMPNPDNRLRFGLILIILIVGITVIVQLAKVLFKGKERT